MADDQAWIDNQGDVWRLGDDGLMHTFETAPFPREYVEKKWGPLKPVHGTIAAYARHRRAGESPCDECKVAWAEYQREYKKAHPENRPRENRYSAARGRALQQLRREFPKRFNEIFAEEMRRDRS